MNLCRESYSTITQPEALSYFPFSLYELSNVGKIDLKIVTYTDFAGGYARHGRDLVEYLENSGLFKIRLEKLKSDINIDPFTYNYFKHLTRTEIDENNFIEMVIGAPGHLERLKKSRAKYKIGYTMFEGNKISKRFLNMCSSCDELFVPTELDVSRFQPLKYKMKITKLPLWVDTDKYKSKIKKAMLVNVPKNNFVFMFVGSWNKRKGINEIIEAYLKEFSSSDNTSLVIISQYSTTPFNDVKRRRHKDDFEKWNILWEYHHLLNKTGLNKKKDKPHICILDVPIDAALMPHFMKNASVCVAASRGESTWLPGLEFGAMGITSIQTAWGGHTDYLNKDNSFPVAFNGFEKCDDEMHYGVSDYYDDTEMIRIDYKLIQIRMREVFDNKYMTNRKGKKLGQFIQKNYSKEVKLEAVKQRLIQIKEELGDN